MKKAIFENLFIWQESKKIFLDFYKKFNSNKFKEEFNKIIESINKISAWLLKLIKSTKAE